MGQTQEKETDPRKKQKKSTASSFFGTSLCSDDRSFTCFESDSQRVTKLVRIFYLKPNNLIKIEIIVEETDTSSVKWLSITRMGTDPN